MAFDNKYLQGETFNPGTDWITAGVCIRFSTVIPGSPFDFLRISQEAAGQYHLALRLSGTAGEPGRLQLRDANKSAVFLTGANVLSADTWHLVELKFKQSNSTDYRVWVDGVLQGSGSSRDFDYGGTHARVEVRTQNNVTGPASPLCTVYSNSWYVRTDDGANIDTNDTRVGPYTVLGPFNWSQSTAAGDFGTALSTGNWDNVKEVPLNDSNKASYSSAAGGGVTAHDGALPGPKGSESIFDGTIMAAKLFWRFKRTGGFGTHKMKGKYGKTQSVTTDNTTYTSEWTVTSSWQDVWVLKDASDANVPGKEDWFQMGFERTSGAGGSHEVSEMWPFILHQEPPSGAMPMAMDHYHRMRKP